MKTVIALLLLLVGISFAGDSENLIRIGKVVTPLAPNHGLESFLYYNGYSRESLYIDFEGQISDNDIESVERASDPSQGITITLSPDGEKRFASLTKEMMGQRLAILHKDRVISTPVLMATEFGNKITLSGNLTEEEVSTLLDAFSK
jgi:preprotein translocase subunit SecD